MGRIPDTVLHARFVRALPAKYDHAKKTIQSIKTWDGEEIIRVVSTRYSTAGAAGAAAVAGTTVVEVTTAVPVVALAVIQVDPKGKVEATTAPVAVDVAAAEVVVKRPPVAVGAASGGVTGESTPRRRATYCPGTLCAQVLTTRRVPAHLTRRYW